MRREVRRGDACEVQYDADGQRGAGGDRARCDEARFLFGMRAIVLRVAAVVDQVGARGDGAERGEDDERVLQRGDITQVMREHERDEYEEVLAPMQRAQRGDDSQVGKL